MVGRIRGGWAAQVGLVLVQLAALVHLQVARWGWVLMGWPHPPPQAAVGGVVMQARLVHIVVAEVSVGLL